MRVDGVSGVKYPLCWVMWMLKRALPLFLSLVVMLTTVGPSLGALVSGGDSCEACSCDRIAAFEEHSEETEEAPCPPQCELCFCTTFSTIVYEKPDALLSPTSSEIEERFGAPLALSLGEPHPLFLPPKT